MSFLSSLDGEDFVAVLAVPIDLTLLVLCLYILFTNGAAH